MRNESFEVPFIASYRKEHISPDLKLADLWKIWQWDEKVKEKQKQPNSNVFVFVF